eukprot:9304392-Alexandrium_andersonii.AAC.1
MHLQPRLTSRAYLWTLHLRDSSPLLRLGISSRARGGRCRPRTPSKEEVCLLYTSPSPRD